MYNFYRSFLLYAAETQALLHDAIASTEAASGKNVPMAWTAELRDAFTKCKRSLANDTLLAHPIEGAELALFCDASSAALQQFGARCAVDTRVFRRSLDRL
jgi:hypothetical protein